MQSISYVEHGRKNKLTGFDETRERYIDKPQDFISLLLTICFCCLPVFVGEGLLVLTEEFGSRDLLSCNPVSLCGILAASLGGRLET